MGAAAQLASVLRDIHGEEFGGEEMGKFTISWESMRALAGGGPLGDDLLAEIAAILAVDDFVLIPMSDAILVAEEAELVSRRATGRLINRYLQQITEEELGFDMDPEDEEED